MNTAPMLGLLLVLLAVVLFACWRVAAGIRRARWAVEDAAAEQWVTSLRDEVAS